MIRSIDNHRMLPQCYGPKLHPFSDGTSDIHFVRLLSDNERAGHSHVFEVIMNGVHYDLKVVSAVSLLSVGAVLMLLVVQILRCA